MLRPHHRCCTMSFALWSVLGAAAQVAATHAPMVMSTGMPMPAPTGASGYSDPHVLALLRQASTPYAGSAWSVFNHRGSGIFIFLWGLTALIAGLQYPRRTWVRFLPPLMLFGLVEFLVLRNDPMTWPLGPIGFWYSMQSPEVFQHRVFILLILLMAIVELLRAADRLPPLLFRYSLPALALVGAILIMIHKHAGPEMQMAMQMQGAMPATGGDPAQSMESSMAHIKREHLSFAIAGFGFVLSKLLADTGRLPGRLGATLWPLFAIATGVLLIGYTE